MSAADEYQVPVDRPARSDEERAADFDELMRLERSRNQAPVSGLGVAALGFALAFVLLAYFFGMFSLVVGASALVFGVFALPQLRHGERRGLVFVLAAMVVLAAGVALIVSAVHQAS
ncbi:hypothetical protein [Actinophytocola sp.]|uniref:hypothetical protein n=1 Tax=Actinophytocola sp. TaxID=1872138 RepID=UPI002D626619|nr:hypothetical protein [Actinophytocola sp.]HYQ67682.1 hypothetical protein [Actinophytocola sp.]